MVSPPATDEEQEGGNNNVILTQALVLSLMLFAWVNVSLHFVMQAAGHAPTALHRRRRQDRMLCKAMCIGIAYSSSIGGITTLPGTSPNLIFSEHLNQ